MPIYITRPSVPNIEIFKKYLVNMSSAPYFKNPENSDLLNIRDEILGDLNKFTYLLTFH